VIYDYYKQFPDVHPNVILKAELLRLGEKFTQEALENFKQRNDINWRGFHIFSYDHNEQIFYGDKLPQTLRFEDGTPVQMRTSKVSPYSVDWRDGRFMITENGEIIADNLMFDPKPRYYDMRLEDGTMMPAIIFAQCNETIMANFNLYCELWNTHDECLFCDINATLRGHAKAESEDVVARKEPSVLTEVMRTIRALDPQLNFVLVSGGSILTKYRGQTEVEFYAKRLEALREGLGGVWLPSALQIRASDDEAWGRLHETGVSSVQPNIEVWDKKLFAWICPGKNKFIGYDEWIRRTIRAVDFWGPGKVNPSFVLGIEMAKPYGFTDVGSAVKSTARGWDFLMSHDVLPRTAYWFIESRSAFHDQKIPPLEYFIEVEKTYTELRWKHGFGLPTRPATRTVNHVSCLCDFEYYHGHSAASKKKIEERGGPTVIKPGDGGYVA